MDEHEGSGAPGAGEAQDELAPITVWLVSRETGQLGWQGSLTLDEQALAFRPEDGGAPRVFRLDQIRKVHRVLGSPVLELRLAPTAPHRLVGFYFVRPPNLEPPRSTTPRPLQKRTARKRAILTLRAANDSKVEDVRAWVRAIRRAMSAQRGPR